MVDPPAGEVEPRPGTTTVAGVPWALPYREAVGELVLVVAGDQPLPEVLQRVAHLAAHGVDGVDDAAVTVHRGGRAGSAGFSSRRAAALDERQRPPGFGPGLETARTGRRTVVASTEPGAPTGFEGFAALARREGVRSAACLPLSAAGRLVGVLSAYGRGPEPLGGEALALAETFATVAGAVVASATNVADAAEQAANLRVAMESRSVIEQAKGVLMVQMVVGEEEAFAELRRRSQAANRKVRDLAAEVVAASTGRPPPRPVA